MKHKMDPIFPYILKLYTSFFEILWTISHVTIEQNTIAKLVYFFQS